MFFFNVFTFSRFWVMPEKPLWVEIHPPPVEIGLKTYIKHLLVFLALNIIFIGQMKKDIGRGVSRVQYLSTADQ